jgi:hypothetical protein
MVVELWADESGSIERHLPQLDATSGLPDKLRTPPEDKRISFVFGRLKIRQPGCRDIHQRLGHRKSIEDAESRVKVTGGGNGERKRDEKGSAPPASISPRF